MQKAILLFILFLFVFCFLSIILIRSPFFQENYGWRLEAIRADIKYALDPPEQVIFTPERTSEATPMPSILSPTPTATIVLETAEPTPIPTATFPPTQTPTPMPESANLNGILHQFQMWNNCGPANLSMALSFWGWKGDQRIIADILKPNARDKNIMPYEMEHFIEEQTELEAVTRVGGDLDTIKAFLSSGFPVIAEKGFEGISFDGWMGHYQVVTGYDDNTETLIVQDSYKGPDQIETYQDFIDQWRAFNYTYIVPFPTERRQQILDILGLQAFDNYNNHYAAQKSLDETTSQTGRDLYFAWFNRGSNLVALQDYTAAASAYDTAFTNYEQIPEEERPWRMMWYQTGPYFAYYYTGRYQDVINLATTTLDAMSEPILEESYYWRAKANIALGQSESAIEDLELCLEAHPDFSPCLTELRSLGSEP